METYFQAINESVFPRNIRKCVSRIIYSQALSSIIPEFSKKKSSKQGEGKKLAEPFSVEFGVGDTSNETSILSCNSRLNGNHCDYAQ